MSVWSSIKNTYTRVDRRLGGYLPGGVSPEKESQTQTTPTTKSVRVVDTDSGTNITTRSTGGSVSSQTVSSPSSGGGGGRSITSSNQSIAPQTTPEPTGGQSLITGESVLVTPSGRIVGSASTDNYNTYVPPQEEVRVTASRSRTYGQFIQAREQQFLTGQLQARQSQSTDVLFSQVGREGTGVGGYSAEGPNGGTSIFTFTPTREDRRAARARARAEFESLPLSTRTRLPVAEIPIGVGRSITDVGLFGLDLGSNLGQQDLRGGVSFSLDGAGSRIRESPRVSQLYDIPLGPVGRTARLGSDVTIFTATFGGAAFAYRGSRIAGLTRGEAFFETASALSPIRSSRTLFGSNQVFQARTLTNPETGLSRVSGRTQRNRFEALIRTGESGRVGQGIIVGRSEFTNLGFSSRGVRLIPSQTTQAANIRVQQVGGEFPAVVGEGRAGVLLPTRTNEALIQNVFVARSSPARTTIISGGSIREISPLFASSLSTGRSIETGSFRVDERAFAGGSSFNRFGNVAELYRPSVRGQEFIVRPSTPLRDRGFSTLGRGSPSTPSTSSTANQFSEAVTQSLSTSRATATAGSILSSRGTSSTTPALLLSSGGGGSVSSPFQETRIVQRNQRRVLSELTQVQSLPTASSQSISPTIIPSSRSRSRGVGGLSTSLLASTPTRQSPFQAAVPTLATRQTTRLITVPASGLTFGGGGGSFSLRSPPFSSNFFPPPPPLPLAGFAGGVSFRNLPSAPQPRGFTPSYRALIQNIQGPRTDNVLRTGLNFRPIPRDFRFPTGLRRVRGLRGLV